MFGLEEILKVTEYRTVEWLAWKGPQSLPAPVPAVG